MLYVIRTLGCKANVYDSQLIEQELQKRGWCPGTRQDFKEVKLCIINSCTVTDEADRQTRKLAARLQKEYPGATIVVTGCAAEVDTARLSGAPGIHYVIGNRSKPELVRLVLEKLDETKMTISENGPTFHLLGEAIGYREMLSRHPADRLWPSISGKETITASGQSDRTRAFLKIQEGCNAFCTYCIIPYGRGPCRSLTPAEILKQVNELVDQGVREIVLTGTHIGRYGVDLSLKADLQGLIEEIVAKTSLERLRISSLDPVEISPALCDLITHEERICPHFHVSLQNPHTETLKRMNRHYSWDDVQNCFSRISRIPRNAFVGMDVIVGFPGETNDDFEWSCQALESSPTWSQLHVFPYSEREGTPAATFSGSVPHEERKRRAKILRGLGFRRLIKHYNDALLRCQQDSRALNSILIEGPTRGPGGEGRFVGGYTGNYLRVLLPSEITVKGNSLVEAWPDEVIFDERSGDVALKANLKRKD